jgi:hypothetical protein
VDTSHDTTSFILFKYLYNHSQLSLLEEADIGEGLFTEDEYEGKQPSIVNKISFVVKLTSFVTFCTGNRVDLYVDPVR